MKNVNFLDTNLGQESYTFKTYMKPNDTQVYVHQLSNHPRGILKNIPYSVNRRLCKISANEDVFKAAVPRYQEAILKGGYAHKLICSPPGPSQKKKQRQRKTTYFNPPFSLNVQSNIGEHFLKA